MRLRRTISLARSPGSLVRFAFHWCPRRELHSHCPRFEVGDSAGWPTWALRNGAPGRSRTDTTPGLSRRPLLVGLQEQMRNGPGGRNCTRTGSVLGGVPLLLGYAGDNGGTPGRTFAYNLRVRSAALSTLSYGSIDKWCAGAVLPRLPPQCQCGDLLLSYRRVRLAAPDGLAPSTSWVKARRSAVEPRG